MRTYAHKLNCVYKCGRLRPATGCKPTTTIKNFAMRSPVIAFSIIAAAAVSPTLVTGAPTSPNPDSTVRHVARQVPANLPGPVGGVAGAVTGLGIISNHQPSTNTNNVNSPEAHRAYEQKLHNPSSDGTDSRRRKRAMDSWTAGGSAYSGATSDTSGGSVVNDANDDADFRDEGGDVGLDNEDENEAGGGGDSYSGFVYGGDGDGKGAGGNAYSGATGPSVGGDVVNKAGNIDNAALNEAGAGGVDESGDAEGGDADGNVDDVNNPSKRAMDSMTGGGDAYTGATGDVSGGDVVNHADDDGVLENDGENEAGAAGDTYSGFAYGGDGNGIGPGGNAYSGATGDARGGSIKNAGGSIDNTDGGDGGVSNLAGAGGESESGDAQGGDA
ncbi:hypothetical protein AcW2_001161 [Taiwanofungus camphoratus]|nr:hypothetical protein AcW2_001161 [Antrodia cinnamomea]